MATAALKEAHRRRLTQTSHYATFQRRYFADPAGFVADCVRWRPGEYAAFYQNDALTLLVKHDRVSVRGPHGLGKTAMMAWAILWFALTRDGLDWKCPTTASNWRQLSRYLWPEVHKWAKRLKWEVIGRAPFDHSELMENTLRLNTGEAFAVASDNAAAIEGAHADHILYLLDEAKVIPPAMWDSIEGALSTGDARILAVSTPGTSTGRFYEIQSRASGYLNWQAMRVTLDDAIKAGRVSMKWADNLRQSWGEGSAAYRRHVLGEFAEDEMGGIVPLSWVEASIDRWRLWHDLPAKERAKWKFKKVGVDVARFGDDQTTLALRQDWCDTDGQAVPVAVIVISELRKVNRIDTMETAGQVAGILTAHGGTASVDVIGIGAGVVDRLREQNLPVSGFNASDATQRRDRSNELGFINKRAAAWWNVRELLDPASPVSIALPPDDMLVGDLTAPRYKEASSGRIQLEGKETIRKRIGRSTDAGDAVAIALFDDKLYPLDMIDFMGEVKGQPKEQHNGEDLS